MRRLTDFFLTLIFPIVFILYVIFVNWCWPGIPFEVITISAIFTALVIGFIVASAMTRYDTYYVNRSLFREKLLLLVLGYPEYRSEALQLAESYAHRTNHDVILPLINRARGDVYLTGLLSSLEDLLTRRIAQIDYLAPALWFAVFIPLIILTIIAVLDDRIGQILSIMIIIVMWLPITTIYYLYITREMDQGVWLQDVQATISTLGP